MTLAIFFLLGLIVGSFLNVVVYRLQLAESLMGRSHCPHCKSKVRWFDNIPLLSFVVLGARCRDCSGKISWQYPAVELLTGLVFALTGFFFFDPWSYQAWGETAFYLFSFSILLVILVYDFRFMEIPMSVLWIGVGMAAAYLLFYDQANFDPRLGLNEVRTYSGMLAGGLAFLAFFLLSALSREKWMGMGDAYLVLLIGLVTGWPTILGALFLAFTSGAIFGIILIALKKKTLQSQVPFGPFLVLGTLAAVLLEQTLFFRELFFWF